VIVLVARSGWVAARLAACLPRFWIEKHRGVRAFERSLRQLGLSTHQVAQLTHHYRAMVSLDWRDYVTKWGKD